MHIEELEDQNSNEIPLKIEENFKRAKIGKIRADTIITSLKCNLPPTIAYKLSLGQDLSKTDLDKIEKIRKNTNK